MIVDGTADGGSEKRKEIRVGRAEVLSKEGASRLVHGPGNWY
jgi:hypothetical protein